MGWWQVRAIRRSRPISAARRRNVRQEATSRGGEGHTEATHRRQRSSTVSCMPLCRPATGGDVRFAFYGRCSTEDAQDPDSSRGWQLRRAGQLIAAVDGEVVKEYFDVGQSRSLPWKRRPRATELLADLEDPGRGWSELVIGEPQRAFYGPQFSLTFPLLTHYG